MAAGWVGVTSASAVGLHSTRVAMLRSGISVLDPVASGVLTRLRHPASAGLALVEGSTRVA